MIESLKIHELTREELEEYCATIEVELECLDEEHEKLKILANDTIELAKKNAEMAENYQKLFQTLCDFIKSEYDAKFTMEDIPKYKS